MYNPYDHYFDKAKKSGYKARSAFKLEAIHDKFHIFDNNTRTVIDVGCAPGSWLQYASTELQKHHTKSPGLPRRCSTPPRNDEGYLIIGFDLKPVKLSLPHVYTYTQDITDRAKVQEILSSHHVEKVDCIISDMAPNTIGIKDIDAIRSFGLLEQWFWMMEELLAPGGKVVVKLFMGPGFDEYIKRMKDLFGGKHIKIFKPDASRTNSKETYVIKI